MGAPRPSTRPRCSPPPRTTRGCPTLTLTRTRTRTPTPTPTLTLSLSLTPNPNLIKLEQVSLHEDRLLLEALLQLIGKAHLQPYAVAATVGPPPPILLLLGRGVCADPTPLYPMYYPMHYDADRRRRRRLHRRLQRQQCLHLGALHLHGWQLGDICAPPNDRQAACLRGLRLSRGSVVAWDV